MTDYVSTFETPSDPRLGRHVRHDPRSWQYAFAAVDTSTLKSVRHRSEIPTLDQGQLGSCFPPGTRVRMADGSERPIEDVRLGERVLTAEGNTGRVVRTLLRDENGGLLRVILWGHSHLRMTREHPVLTSRGYVPVSDLRVGDEVALPKYTAAQSVSVTTADHVTQASHRLVRGNRWTGVQGRRGLRVGSHALPEKIDLDEGFGRLIGLFLAEGNCDSGKVVWTYSEDEIDTLAAETVALLARYEVEAHVRPVPAQHSCKVVVHGTAWTRLMSSLCGDGAGMKRLHPDLAAGPEVFLANVLSGWLDGDGCRRKDGSREAITISRELALGMYDIAQAQGHHPVIVRSEPVMNNVAATRQPRWTITLAPGRGRCRQDDTTVWGTVRETRLEEYVGAVYDLTVEGDHSYVAEGVGVHNCTGNAATKCLSYDPFWPEKDVQKVLGPDEKADEEYAVGVYSAATQIDDYPGSYPPQDTGSDGLSVAKVLKKRGLISGYQHAFSLEALLSALAKQPVIVGTQWHQDMFSPAADGRLSVTGKVAGGHEYCLDELDVENERIWMQNSWGDAWGKEGRAYLTWDDMRTLLKNQGDCTIFAPLGSPPPTPPDPDPQAAFVAAAKTWLSFKHVSKVNVAFEEDLKKYLKTL